MRVKIFYETHKIIIKILVLIMKKQLTNAAVRVKMIERVRARSAHCTAMMQEIAPKGGNFCGVCPVIGRLNCFCLRCVYRCGRGKVGLVSTIFLGSE